MTNREIIQEGILDWIQRQREEYNKAVTSPGEDTSWAGRVGTAAGKAVKYGRTKAVPAIAKTLRTAGERLEKSPISATRESNPYSIKGIVKRKTFGEKWGNLSNLDINRNPIGKSVTAGITRASKSPNIRRVK